MSIEKVKPYTLASVKNNDSYVNSPENGAA